MVNYCLISLALTGEFHTPLRGIPRGSALSPLLAAFHLTETDNVFSRNRHVTYARYMDDFLILSPTGGT
ncbi:hypothetical protein QJC37_005015 [Salmonella enterica]|nr:hypothetical protein [Salmonella enterica]